MASAIDDPEELKNKTKELQEISWRVTQQAYQQGSSESQDASNEQKKDGKFEEEKK